MRRKVNIPNSKRIIGSLFIFLGITALAIVTPVGGLPQGSGETVLYQEDFEGGTANGWDLGGNWKVVQDAQGNWALHGQGHHWAQYTRDAWGDYTVKLRVKLIRGTIHLNYRVSNCTRYFIGFGEQSLYFNKTSPCENHQELRFLPERHSTERWYEIKITGKGNKIDIYVDGLLKISYVDPDPLLYGTIALETLEESEVYVDDITVLGQAPPTLGLRWTKTGGPLGGLGYDVRMRPDNPDMLYVTDAWSGVNMSEDGGHTWFASNKGIITRAGPSGDAIPIFSLTIDPHNPDIIWTGTQNTRGIYKSTDGGRKWVEKINGIVEQEGITFRGFTVDPRDSNIVYAAAEISSFAWTANGEERMGRYFDLVKGVVYKTTDGGEHWAAIWRGDNLARYIWINPRNPEVIYVSTGIFDREAANSDAGRNLPGGVGLLKSTDGGRTWRILGRGNGLKNLYIGSLFMHPENPDILLVGAGNLSYSAGSGIYLSTDGGETWTQTHTRRYEVITSVEFSTSNPHIAYAGGELTVYRSEDGGRSWEVVNGGPPTNQWGPPGIRPGFPIDFQVDPRDASRIFANNYGGGNFLSEDGGHTWTVASRGYTGADLTDVTVHPSNPAIVYVNGRSGPFMSPDAGVTWHGVNPINVRPISEGARVVVDPHNPSHVLMSDKEGATYESMDGGMQWTLVTNFSDEEFQGMQAITFAPSTPGKVYGGFGVYPCATDAIEWSCNTPTSVSILTSEDGGRTWTHHEGTALDGLTVTEIVVHPLNADTAWAATVGGGVFRTSDGGVTWEPASNGLIDKRVMNLAGDPNNPGVLYAGTAGGGVFKSENGGASWRASSVGMAPNEPIGAIVVDPVRPNVVYAGSWSSGVFISDDAGATWRKLNDGLRTRSVRALAISSGGEVLYAGTRGEGVFKLALASIEAVKMPPIIDTHVHIWPTTEAENQQYIDQLVDAMVRSNVKKVALGLNARHISQRPPTYSPEHDQFVLAAYQRHPSRIIPMLAGFDPQDESAVDYVKTQLETGPWQGIGELDLRNEPKQTTNPADHPVMMQIYQLAAQYHVPVLIHFDPCYGISCTGGMEEIRRALRANPETIFIWAHGCPLDLMTAYSNLYCEHESPGESLPHEFPDRTLLGTDIQDPNLRNNLPDHSVISYEETIDRLRQELSRLNPQDAEKVAYKNAQHLFHLTASP